ncbi:unnamed protein product, partial [Linum tenue]
MKEVDMLLYPLNKFGQQAGIFPEAYVNLTMKCRVFNLELHCVEKPVPDYVQATVSTVLLIHDQ